jgi:hypothetical protein
VRGQLFDVHQRGLQQRQTQALRAFFGLTVEIDHLLHEFFAANVTRHKSHEISGHAHHVVLGHVLVDAVRCQVLREISDRFSASLLLEVGRGVVALAQK